jgi:hypothetical protein
MEFKKTVDFKNNFAYIYRIVTNIVNSAILQYNINQYFKVNSLWGSGILHRSDGSITTKRGSMAKVRVNHGVGFFRILFAGFWNKSEVSNRKTAKKGRRVLYEDDSADAVSSSPYGRGSGWLRIGLVFFIVIGLTGWLAVVPGAYGQGNPPSYDTQSQLQLAKTLLKDHRYIEAVSLLRNILDTQPLHQSRFELLLMLADGLMGLGDYDGAEDAIDKADRLAMLSEETEAVRRRRSALTVLTFRTSMLEEVPDTVRTEVQAQVPEEERLEPMVTNSFFETDIRQVLIDITMETGVPILWDATVEGLVTYEAEYQPLEEVLRAILFPLGYTYMYEDGTYYVGSVHIGDPAFGLLSETEVMTMANVEASEAIRLLSDFFEPYVKAYDAANVVCITAPPTMLGRIKDDLKALDVPPDQILIEVIFSEIATDALREMGLDWSLSGTTENPVWDFTVDNTELESTGILGNYTELGIDVGEYTVDLVASLEALVQSGDAKIRANPRITTMNGRTAEISLIKDQYFVIQTGTSQYNQYNTLQAVSSGIRLEITPYTSSSGEITLYLKPEVGDVVGKGANDLPEISTRSASTSVRVMDGETFTIGGLSLQQEKTTRKKVPFLGDIPFLGYIFRYDRKEVRDTEIIIFVTPHILEG